MFVSRDAACGRHRCVWTKSASSSIALARIVASMSFFTSSDQPDARREGPALKLAEGSILRRIHHVVDHRGILAAGGILHHAAQAPILPAKMKLPFQSGAEVDIIGKALTHPPRPPPARAAFTAVNGKPVCQSSRYTKSQRFLSIADRNRQPAPGDHAIGRVPRPAVRSAAAPAAMAWADSRAPHWCAPKSACTTHTPCSRSQTAAARSNSSEL